jgi:hypothetical protein
VPLQNRVSPFATIEVYPARGLFMGNRGGRIHNADKKLQNRRWASRAWIYCVLQFKNRHRQVMLPNHYTELFFLDEVTALAAGHRPCFECQRARALELFAHHAEINGLKQRISAPAFDEIVHAARLNGREKRTSVLEISTLADGAMIAQDNIAWALRGGDLLAWSYSGYTSRKQRPATGRVEVLTPEPFLDILTAGYQPAFHPSADNVSAHIT